MEIDQGIALSIREIRAAAKTGVARPPHEALPPSLTPAQIETLGRCGFRAQSILADAVVVALPPDCDFDGGLI